MTVVGLVAGLSLMLQGPVASPAVDPSPFAGFETQYLANGLKVWFKRLPGDPIVSISVALPVGFDQDPPGLNQLAHFTEHMLFSDQPGKTEEQIRGAIQERGGLYNAWVRADRTFYFVRIGKEQARFALEWLFQILAPHAMDAQVVERQRGPVALEMRARPRQALDWLRAAYLDPPWLRMPDFWEREFGLETWTSRDYYPYASLQRIRPEDLRWFYDRYYVPSLMTVTVIGDLDRDAVLDRLAETFATLPARREPPLRQELRDPERSHRRHHWSYRSNVHYSLRFKFFRPSADDDVMLIFLGRLLGKRLNDQLRFGERKATYGLTVGSVRRGDAAYFEVSGGITPSELAFARAVVDRELDALRRGTMPESEFRADRDAVARQIRVANTSPQDLERWVDLYFYDTRVHRDFPDLVGAFEQMGLAEVETFVRANFVPQRQYEVVAYRHPITQAALAALVLGLVWLALRAGRRMLIRPLEMSRLRYVARFRMPKAYLLATGTLFLVIAAVSGRALVYLFQVVTDRYLLSIDSFWIQWLAYAAMLVLGVLWFLFLLSRIPRRLLIFEGGFAIKYLSYRSVQIPATEIEELGLRRFPAVWLSKRIWKCVPLALGLTRPALYLKRKGGWAYYFDVRDRDETLSVARRVQAASTRDVSA